MGPPPITTANSPVLQVAHAHVVAGHGHGLHHGALRSAERIGQAVQGVRGHRPHALQRARRIDADELQVLADVAVAGGAGGAIAARVERTHGDAVARAPARHSAAHAGDGARHFVAHHVRQGQTVRHGAVKEMQVGAADAAIGNADLHLPGARLHGHAFAHAQCPIAFEEYRLHE